MARKHREFEAQVIKVYNPDPEPPDLKQKVLDLVQKWPVKERDEQKEAG